MNSMAQETYKKSRTQKKMEEREEAYPKSLGSGHRSRNCLTVSSLCNPATNDMQIQSSSRHMTSLPMHFKKIISALEFKENFDVHHFRICNHYYVMDLPGLLVIFPFL